MTDTTTVKVFQSTDTGAPSLSGTAGALISVLDACLQDGYGSVTLDSLVVSSNVATATKSAGHGFTAIGTVGPVIRIAEATPSGLNGDWRITVVSATQFTFATSGISDQTATGTITAKRAPAGFTKAFTGTNKAAYRADDLASTRIYLRVDDSPAQYPVLKCYETMSDVDTGTGAFPSAARYVCKSYSANSTARAWKVISDGRMFYFVNNANSDTYRDSFCFGDIVPYKSGDAYHALLIAETADSSWGNDLLYSLTAANGDFARAYTQIVGSSVTCARYSHGKTGHLGQAGNPYPNEVDNSFHAWPVEAWESTTRSRGLMPGLWNPIHAHALLAEGTVITDIPQLSGRSMIVVRLNSSAYCAAFDITGPWR